MHFQFPRRIALVQIWEQDPSEWYIRAKREGGLLALIRHCRSLLLILIRKQSSTKSEFQEFRFREVSVVIRGITGVLGVLVSDLEPFTSTSMSVLRHRNLIYNIYATSYKNTGSQASGLHPSNTSELLPALLSPGSLHLEVFQVQARHSS